jgi:RNA polymerase sigma factor (sigma-70 family)
MILGPVPASHSKAPQAKAPRGLSAYFSSLYAYPLLTAEEEIYYFRKMNYLKFNASQLRERLISAESKMHDVDEFTDLQQQADEVKRLLICSNLRLVVSIARKYIRPNVSLFELVSDGNLWLIRSIEKFDFTRGFKFSTYASASITRNFARSLSVERTQLNRFRTGSDEVFSQSPDLHEGSFIDEIVNHRQHEALMRMVSKLSVRDSEIIIARFGLSHLSRPQTLQEIGLRFGVSRERIRHMEMRALSKLRKLAKRERFDLPGFSSFGE